MDKQELKNKLDELRAQKHELDAEILKLKIELSSITPTRITKKVIMMDEDGSTLRRFNSISEAGLAMSPSKSSQSISNCCRRTAGSAHGYHWKYED